MTENQEILDTPQQNIVEEEVASKNEKDIKADLEKEEQTKNQVLEKYLAKKSFKKRISYFIALGVSCVLAITILLLACIKVNVVPHFLMDTPVADFSVYHNNSFDYSVDDEDVKYDEFNKLYKQAFSMSVFSAMFSGQVGGYVIGEDNETYNQFSSANITTLLESEDYVRVGFDGEVTVLNSNKTVYKSIRNSQAERIYFNEFYFALSSENAFKDVKILVPVYGNYVKDESKPMIFQMMVQANLFNFSNQAKDFIK